MICIKSLNFFAISFYVFCPQPNTCITIYNYVALYLLKRTYEWPNSGHFHEIWNQGVP